MTLCMVVAAVVTATASHAANADRVTGLTPDEWGQTAWTAQANLRARYLRIKRISCVCAVMAERPLNESSWRQGSVRYWDKLTCTGVTSTGKRFSLIYDQVGPTAWKIYRLEGVSVASLRGGGALPPPPAPP